MIKYIKNQDGFTLIEIMVSMVISSLVIAGVYGVYTIQQRSYTVQEQVSEMQQRIRAAVDFMSREMRMAGYNPPEPYDQVDNCQNAAINEADTQIFDFSYCDVTADKKKDEKDLQTYSATLETSRYQLDNGVLRKNSIAIAEGIDALEFRYLSSEIDPNTKKPKVLDTPVTDRTAIRAVEISILVRSTYPDMKHTDTMLYIPFSTDRTWNGTFNVNPPNDNFHRRLLTITIYLRNMGVQK